MSNLDLLKSILEKKWPKSPNSRNEKVQKYVEKFNNRSCTDTKITAKVRGNHGIYTVSIELLDANEEILNYACSCYIGKYGDCHHCLALIMTFLNNTESFKKVKVKNVVDIQYVSELERYLKSVTLDSLVQQLKAKGITQKAFAESMGMPSSHLGAVKRSESRNRFFHELGAIKVACLWALEHLDKDKVEAKRKIKK